MTIYGLATVGKRAMCSFTATLVSGLSIGAIFFGMSGFLAFHELFMVPSTMQIICESITLACSLSIFWKTFRTIHFFLPLGNSKFFHSTKTSSPLSSFFLSEPVYVSHYDCGLMPPILSWHPLNQIYNEFV